MELNRYNKSNIRFMLTMHQKGASLLNTGSVQAPQNLVSYLSINDIKDAECCFGEKKSEEFMPNQPI